MEQRSAPLENEMRSEQAAQRMSSAQWMELRSYGMHSECMSEWSRTANAPRSGWSSAVLTEYS